MKNLLVVLRKNLIPIIIVLAVVGLLVYMTQRKEGFKMITCTKGKTLQCPKGSTIIRDECYTCSSGRIVNEINKKVYCVSSKRNTLNNSILAPIPATVMDKVCM